MKKIACLGAVALLALVGCQSSEKKATNMSVMSEKSGSCCSENPTCGEKSAAKGNMSVMSEKKGDSAQTTATCPVTGKTGRGH